MSVYFNPMQQAMTDNCSKDVHVAVEYAAEPIRLLTRILTQ